MKAISWKLLFGAALCLLLAGCSKETEEEAKYHLYYVDYDKEVIDSQDYEPSSEEMDRMIQEVYEKIMDKGENGRGIFPSEVSIQSYERSGYTLTLDMGEAYRKIEPVHEILCRAALVKNFVQIPGISYVQMKLEGEDLLDSEENAIGAMSQDSFLENSGKDITAYQYMELDLYFANKEGDALVKEKRPVYYTSNSSIEKVVVEQLIRGPKEEGNQAVLPPATKIIGVSVADGVAYVNLDQAFVTEALPIEEQLPIYAIANSLISTGNVMKVQISVNGDTKVTFRESMNLDQMYQWNGELVGKEEE